MFITMKTLMAFSNLMYSISFILLNVYFWKTKYSAFSCVFSADDYWNLKFNYINVWNAFW